LGLKNILYYDSKLETNFSFFHFPSLLNRSVVTTLTFIFKIWCYANVIFIRASYRKLRVYDMIHTIPNKRKGFLREGWSSMRNHLHASHTRLWKFVIPLSKLPWQSFTFLIYPLHFHEDWVELNSIADLNIDENI